MRGQSGNWLFYLDYCFLKNKRVISKPILELANIFRKLAFSNICVREKLGNFSSYYIEAGKDMFGNWIVEINYGRIGCKGRKKIFLINCEEDAKMEVKKRLKKRERLVKKIGVGYSVKLVYGKDWFESSNPDYIFWWIQLRSAILVLMRLLAMCQQKIPYEVF